ncbi:MAG: S8 family serine peptidase [Candidatus Methanodesulfokora sp.]|jgi:subtilisin family serine protease
MDFVDSRKSLAILVICLFIATSLSPIWHPLIVKAETGYTAYIDPILWQKIVLASPLDKFEVIITFKDRVYAQRISSITTNYTILRALPIVAAILTKDQILEISTWKEVRSIYLNSQLKYFNFEAGEITGAHYVQQKYGFTGRGVTIAILDSGIDGLHPDLQYGPSKKVVQNVKIITTFGSTEPVYVEDVPDTDTTSGHGTHCAGIAAGWGNMSEDDIEKPPAFGRWLDGVAPGAKLVGLGAGEALWIFSALEGFDWILTNYKKYNIRIVSNSWGTSGGGFDPNNPINIATYELYIRGITVVFAAGNEGPDQDTMNPYSLAPWVISVGAGTDSKQLTDFSSRGVPNDPYKHPDIVAPGYRIVSTRAQGTIIGSLGNTWNLEENHKYNNHYAEYVLWYQSLSGTSMATPFVAGAIALLLEANPELSPDQIIDILTKTADPMYKPDGSPYEFWEVGAGYINVTSAVKLALETPGKLNEFLQGDVMYASQGEWNIVDDTNTTVIAYGGWRWVNKSSDDYLSRPEATAYGGSMHRNPGFSGDYVELAFMGRGIKLSTLLCDKCGLAEVYIDGRLIGTVDTYNKSTAYQYKFGWLGLSDDIHKIKIVVTGDHNPDSKGSRIYIDAFYIDGRPLPASSNITTEAYHFSGTMGPSFGEIGILTETNNYTLAINESTLQLSIELSWNTTADLDLYLIDQGGKIVASSATLSNPELIKVTTPSPGNYTIMVKGYVSVYTPYSLDITITKIVTP